jgi:hypothetical protein
MNTSRTGLERFAIVAPLVLIFLFDFLVFTGRDGVDQVAFDLYGFRRAIVGDVLGVTCVVIFEMAVVLALVAEFQTWRGAAYCAYVLMILSQLGIGHCVYVAHAAGAIFNLDKLGGLGESPSGSDLVLLVPLPQAPGGGPVIVFTLLGGSFLVVAISRVMRRRSHLGPSAVETS